MSTTDPIYRRFNFLGFILCLTAVIYAIYSLQDPITHTSSPLVSISKLLVLINALLFFMALIHNPQTFGQRFYGTLNTLLSATGITLASYHLWKHSISSTLSPATCEQPIELLLSEQKSINGKLAELINAAIQCPVEQISLIGLGTAEQCLILFVALFVISWKILTRRTKNKGLFL
ncbi:MULTISPECIES: disulfide bond formation protein B [unclassified Neptuniibacter]|jgi:disulfide bond formation protein DsbB|uniref:disulfide bond formation protein B n=1 Tax=unclassified Neptuniibacter TaxID=2630693 RepID=UPI0026E3A91C|nr:MULTISPECIES: disulfide bond formation protein B [unclassified Neptuniibacter]MDO6513064.1 disulfide bond formation protein B [Neptuniibacter sp. 2_MG-2023]MDO6592524.1 disulfide bond formation protein B [Neptuniibacter sp. 1_MG-2023]